MEQIIIDVLRHSMKVKTIQAGDRIINPGDVSTSINIVLKGNALVRIPYDNIKTKMTVKKYF